MRLFEGRAILQSVLTNTSLLVTDRIVRYGLGFLIGAAIARYLGPEQYGLMSFVLSLVAMLIPLLGVGLDNMIVREIVHQPDNIDRVLGSAFGLRLLGGVAMIVTSLVVTIVLRPGDTLCLLLVMIMEAATMMLCFDVLEVWFQSQLLSKYPIYGKGLAFLLISAVKTYFIAIHASVTLIILAGFLEAAIGAAGLIYYYKVTGRSVLRFKIDREIVKLYLREGWMLVLAGIASVVYLRIDQLFIAKILGDSAVGIYSAAFRFTEFAYALPSLVAVSILPILVESKLRDATLYTSRLRTFLNVMALAGIVVALGFTFLAGYIIPLLFGHDYASSVDVLKIQIWSAVFMFLIVASNQHLVVEKRTDIILARTLAGMVLNIVLNAIVIPSYGLSGAAVVGLASNAVVLLSIVFYKDERQHALDLLKSLNFFKTLMTIRSVI